MSIALSEAIAAIEQACTNPQAGLPHEVFKLLSKLTPMINVDLLIKDEAGNTLLTWRDDPLCKPGWHIPGGIIRFMENIGTRIQKVAETELGTSVSYDPEPIKITEFILPKQAYRNHFISLLFQCKLVSPPSESLLCQDVENPQNGQYFWFDKAPGNLLKVHHKYQSFIGRQ